MATHRPLKWQGPLLGYKMDSLAFTNKLTRLTLANGKNLLLPAAKVKNLRCPRAMARAAR